MILGLSCVDLIENCGDLPPSSAAPRFTSCNPRRINQTGRNGLQWQRLLGSRLTWKWVKKPDKDNSCFWMHAQAVQCNIFIDSFPFQCLHQNFMCGLYFSKETSSAPKDRDFAQVEPTGGGDYIAFWATFCCNLWKKSCSIGCHLQYRGQWSSICLPFPFLPSDLDF